MRTICSVVQVFFSGTSRDGCMQKMPKQSMVGPNVETVLEFQVIALNVSLDVQDTQEVSTQPMVEQEIPEQPVASSSVVTALSGRKYMFSINGCWLFT